MTVARIRLGEDEANRRLEKLCERTGTTREFWDGLADEFLVRYRETPIADVREEVNPADDSQT